MDMRSDIKEKWVADLRANGHLQGKHALQTFQNKFCCWGRLCELYRQETSGAEWVFATHLYRFVDRNNGMSGTTMPPQYVLEWAEVETGIFFIIGQVDRNGIECTLQSLNDMGFTFDQIADIIEYFVKST